MAERMNTESLRYVQAVVRTGSFSAAARAHGVTQPALSNGVARLERQLGDKLFTRSPRGVSLTTFGTRMVPLVDRALAALDAVDAEANRWSRPEMDTIRMGVSPLIDPALIARFHRAVSGADADPFRRQLVLREANMADLRDGLIADDLDLIVIPSVGPMPRYEHRVVASEPLVLVMADGHSRTAQLAELADLQLILLPDTCGLTTVTRDLLSSRELPMHSYPGEATSYRVLEEWSLLGIGSAMLPQSRLTTSDQHRREVLDEEGLPVEIFYEAVWDPTSALAPALGALTDAVGTGPDAG